MDYLAKLIGEIECHSVEGIKECFENGVNPNDLFKDKPLIYELITEYGRGPLFKECVKVFVNYGLVFEDKILLAVLLDDTVLLEAELNKKPEAIWKKYSFPCAFTPLYEAGLLHICAEYNHIACAEFLVNHGADVNDPAGFDENGFGGQTPIFHAVNQHADGSADMRGFLLSKSAIPTLTVAGLIWGKGYPWETFIPAVNPVSYAMMGLLPQFQRKEVQIYNTVRQLLTAGYGIDYAPMNVPNAYLYG